MNAKLNLSRVFEYGQAYVALSRVSSMEGLILTGSITQQTFQIHPEVRRQDAKLTNIYMCVYKTNSLLCC